MINALCFFLLCCVLVAPVAGQSETLKGRVVGVADGDTITVLDIQNRQHKIRLAGIDAPEKAQPFGQRSKQSLSDLAYGKTVAVETSKRDKYGREVGKVLVNGSTDANLEQIRRGLAWHYKAYENEQSLSDREAYAGAEKEAQGDHRGLWKEARPTAPWDYRQNKRKTGNRGGQSREEEALEGC